MSCRSKCSSRRRHESRVLLTGVRKPNLGRFDSLGLVVGNENQPRTSRLTQLRSWSTVRAEEVVDVRSFFDTQGEVVEDTARWSQLFDVQDFSIVLPVVHGMRTGSGPV